MNVFLHWIPTDSAAARIEVIQFRMDTATMRKFTLDIQPKWAVKAVKSKLYRERQRDGVPQVSKQRLEFCDSRVEGMYTVLHDGRSLRSYNIRDGSTLFLSRSDEPRYNDHGAYSCLILLSVLLWMWVFVGDGCGLLRNHSPTHLRVEDYVDGECPVVTKQIVANYDSLQRVLNMSSTLADRFHNASIPVPLAGAVRNPEAATETLITDFVVIESSKPVKFTRSYEIRVPLNAHEVRVDPPGVDFVVKELKGSSSGYSWEDVDGVVQDSEHQELVIPVGSLAGQTVFTCVARSRNGRPIHAIIAKKMQLSIFGNEIRRGKETVAIKAVMAATTLKQSENEETIPSKGRNKFVRYSGPIEIVMSVFEGITLEMTTVDGSRLYFRPPEVHISRDELCEARNCFMLDFSLNARKRRGTHKQTDIECKFYVTFQPRSFRGTKRKEGIFTVSRAEEVCM